MSEETVELWRRMLKAGRTNVHDEERSDRPAIYNEGWSCSMSWPKNVKNGDSQIQKLSSEFPQTSRTPVYDIITDRPG
jgi:hypothetical protein